MVIEEHQHKREIAHDEEELIRNAQANPDEFRVLYERYFKKIFLFVLHRIGDRALTADITSQVFLKALININKFSFRGLPFSAWLFRIALNECNSFFRSNKRHRIVSIEHEMVSHLHVELTTDSSLQDLEEKLPYILQKLSMDELQLIELRFFEQRPFKEMASILNITETYAKVKVYRVLDKMKKYFLQQK
ncbi:MAG TPA: RNA polymerase sigma factor [Chryseolinea sp.]|nr:RNA polymerase sigma factor [Chryseolinea sp.]